MVQDEDVRAFVRATEIAQGVKIQAPVARSVFGAAMALQSPVREAARDLPFEAEPSDIERAHERLARDGDG